MKKIERIGGFSLLLLLVLILPIQLGAQNLSVREVRRLGANLPSGSPYEMAHASAIAQADDSTVWVLDRIWPKIVGFSQDGTPIASIVLTRGEGPGEVQNPIDLTSSGDRLVLLDHGLGRVTILTREGALVDDIRLESGAAWRFAITEDRIWTTKATRPSQSASVPVVYEHDWEGRVLGRPETRHPDDLRHGLGLAFGDMGTTVITTAKTPGAFWVHRPQDSRRYGSYVYPDQVPWQSDDGRLVVPFQVPAIGVLPSGEVVQHWYQFSDGEQMLDPRRQGLVLLTANGEVIGRSELPATVPVAPSYSEISSVTGHFFVPVNEFIPMVTEYEVVRR